MIKQLEFFNDAIQVFCNVYLLKQCHEYYGTLPFFSFLIIGIFVSRAKHEYAKVKQNILC